MTASVIHRHRVKPPCPCGNCSVEHGFCDEHAARLAQLREDYQTDWRQKLSSTANGGRKTTGAPACCRPDCWRPRTPGEPFCEACQAEGYADGIGE